jgi:hypothetical protein
MGSLQWTGPASSLLVNSASARAVPASECWFVIRRNDGVYLVLFVTPVIFY